MNILSLKIMTVSHKNVNIICKSEKWQNSRSYICFMIMINFLDCEMFVSPMLTDQTTKYGRNYTTLLSYCK